MKDLDRGFNVVFNPIGSIPIHWGWFDLTKKFELLMNSCACADDHWFCFVIFSY